MFESDEYPNKLKILFIGHPSSSHTISWIDLLKEEEINVRLFGFPAFLPPENWKVKTYITNPDLPSGLNTETRLWFYPRPEEIKESNEKALTLEAMRQQLIRQENLLQNTLQSKSNEIIHNAINSSYQFYRRLIEEERQNNYSYLRESNEIIQNAINSSYQFYRRLIEEERQNNYSYKFGRKVNKLKGQLRNIFRKDKIDKPDEYVPVTNEPPESPFVPREPFVTTESFNIDCNKNDNLIQNISMSAIPGLVDHEPLLSELIPPQPQIIYDTRFPSIDIWLSEIIKEWKPDIIHTLGLDPAGLFFNEVRNAYPLEGLGKWVAQLRGGSDLTISRFDPLRIGKIINVLQNCDSILSDNLINIAYAKEMGIPQEKFSSICPVPGTGGIDITELSGLRQGKTSFRRAILWPKAYDSPWSLAMPVLEAIKLVWEDIQPCEINILAVTPEFRMWFNTLPNQIKNSCTVYDRISRCDVLKLMGQSRVMLAPSLVDGVPNTLYEAMASGAFPIVSPLDTITPVVKPEQNVLFARNLYPDEIAAALKIAMTDDKLVDLASDKNLELVTRIANRDSIRSLVVEFYNHLASS